MFVLQALGAPPSVRWTPMNPCQTQSQRRSLRESPFAGAHAALADAAVAGLSAHLDTLDSQAWRRVAGAPLGT
jgi:hypothetical protein